MANVTLTKEQESFLISSGRVVLCACPGSGKTHITARKFLSYFDTWTLPHQGVAVLSFTNVASVEMEEQAKNLKDGLFKANYPHYIGTIDSFINKFVLLRFGYLYLNGKRPRIFRKDLFKFPFRFWKNECYQNGCISTFHEFRIGGDGRLYKKDQPISCSGKDGADAPCVEYKKLLLKHGVVFQSDVAGIACRILDKYPSIANALAKRFPVIIIDEAQDTSKEQMQLFDIINCSGIDSMFLVGDPDQAIYEWRGASPDFFVEKLNSEDWEKKYLNHNFRSSQHICNAVQAFSNTIKDKSPNISLGDDKSFSKRPILMLYDEQSLPKDSIINKFIEISNQLGIECCSENIAVVTRGKINNATDISELWKSSECELFAMACYTFIHGKKREALDLVEKALFGITVDDLKNIPHFIETAIESRYRYSVWKNLALNILTMMPSPKMAIAEWVKQLLGVLETAFEMHGINCRRGVELNKYIKIKSKDAKHPDFKNIPLLNYFEVKKQGRYTISSVHGVKGESYQSLLLLISSRKGKTLTPKFLSEGALDTELMRIAYVAMTRPKKLLVVAMPCGKTKNSVFPRFPLDKWEYVYL